jgi:hypothetical protein
MSYNNGDATATKLSTPFIGCQSLISLDCIHTDSFNVNEFHRRIGSQCEARQRIGLSRSN